VRIKIELDPEATDRLIEVAIAHRRPVPMQAEVLLLEALGFRLPRLTGAALAEIEPGGEVVDAARA
jgi:hypothetical protein